MQGAKLERLLSEKHGRLGFSRSIKPCVRTRDYKGEIVGFDTEYTSKTAELICYQLYANGKGLVKEVKRGEKLTPLKLYHSACELLEGVVNDVLFITYFSLAELQFLPVVSEGFNIQEYANGSLDVEFHVNKRGTGYGAILGIFDLARWFDRRPLKAAAKSFGLEKLDMDTSKVTRKHLRTKGFKKYALNDAILCYEICTRLRQNFNALAQVDIIAARTPANASQYVFRKLYIKKKYYCDENRARLLAMKGCWGGRAEVFNRGKLKGTYTEYDFKGAYPQACVNIGEFPVQGSWKPLRSLRNLDKYKGGFAHVYFEFPKGTDYPSLPVYSGDCLLYPLQGESYCTTYEVQAAKSQGAKLRLAEGWVYTRGVTDLSEYMELAIEKRRTAKGASNIMWKLLANSLTGKFAQNLKKVPIDEYFRLAEEYGDYIDEIMSLNRHELVALGAREIVTVGPVFMPEWYGLITGYCRAQLGRAAIAGKAVYVHTDSVWCKKKPGIKLPLLLEKKNHGSVTIIRTRLARIGRNDSGHTAFHSIRDRGVAQKLITDFGRSKTGKIKREYKKARPLKFKEATKTGRVPGKWVVEKIKADTFWDGKRRVFKDGTTIPWLNVSEYLENKVKR